MAGPPSLDAVFFFFFLFPSSFSQSARQSTSPVLAPRQGRESERDVASSVETTFWSSATPAPVQSSPVPSNAIPSHPNTSTGPVQSHQARAGHDTRPMIQSAALQPGLGLSARARDRRRRNVPGQKRELPGVQGDFRAAVVCGEAPLFPAASSGPRETWLFSRAKERSDGRDECERAMRWPETRSPAKRRPASCSLRCGLRRTFVCMYVRIQIDGPRTRALCRRLETTYDVDSSIELMLCSSALACCTSTKIRLISPQCWSVEKGSCSSLGHSAESRQVDTMTGPARPGIPSVSREPFSGRRLHCCQVFFFSLFPSQSLSYA
ncbi:hypothetical protein J3F84DRAFT_222540 [Trichoderma pleuroticola]